MATDIIAKSRFIKLRIVVSDSITSMYDYKIVAARHENVAKQVDRSNSLADVRISSDFFSLIEFLR